MKSLLALLLLAPLSAAQTVWYVDDDGTPPGTGTLADPYTSIQYAVDQATTQHTDELRIAPGTYVENVNTGAKVLRVRGAGPELSILMPAGPGPILSMPSGVELSGVTLTGCQTAGVGAFVSSSFNTTVITDCLIVGNAGHGLQMEWDYELFGCTITDNGGEGVHQTSPLILDVRQNIVWGNGAPPTFKPFGMATNVIAHNNFPPEPANLANGFGPNIDADPLFVDSVGGDYHLQPNSPSIDSGDPKGPKDADGSLPDMGVFTHDASTDPGTLVYCESQVNSLGCTPAIAATGFASLSGTPFDITCSNVINKKLGLMFYGYQQKSLPYQGGTLCVAGLIRRTSVQNSGGSPVGRDCTGTYTYDFDARLQSGADPALVLGQVVYAQYWFRDPVQITGNTTGRSDALKFAILP